jgi:orotate phosphoribosyltransferase
MSSAQLSVPGGPQRTRLVELLRERSFERKRVILASGRESDFFIDCKQAILTAEGHALVGELMYDALGQLPRCEAVGGVELGGCPLASAVSLVSFQKGRPLPALYVRKAKKDHGSAKLVEGDKAITPNMPVVLLEDVVTTGGSSLRAVESLRAVGVNVVGIVAICDRLEGGRETIEAAGLPLISLTTRRDFMND